MKTVSKSIIREFIINKSKFITKIYPVVSETEINIILENLKKEHKDATHICYCYIIDNIKRFQDDGEPSGTAGIPMLNVLEQNNLNYVLAVVIRYFGGIKLGAGGLIRAYSNCISKSLNSTSLVVLKDGVKLEVHCSYSSLQTVEKILENGNIINKDFQENIIIYCEISNKDYYIIKDNLAKYCINILEKEHLLIRN